MRDRWGREISYLRVSVTDKCNLRCIYCSPRAACKLPRDELLTYEEIKRVVEEAVRLGVRKVRITGGEPLLRRGIVGLVEMLRGIEGLEELVMTTNGTLLARHAQDLASAGLERVNISIDSLKPDVYRLITGGELEEALMGLKAAERAGLPVKVNVVVMRGLNDDEIPRFAEMAVRYGWHVRFIELMPFGVGGALHKLLFFPSDQILDILREKGIDLKPLPAEDGSTAQTFRAGAGRIGLISPLSKPFCSSCNRMRISADGKLRTCLLSGIGIDLKRALRSGAAGDELRSLILRAAMLKPFKHNVKPGAIEIRSMAEIGG